MCSSDLADIIAVHTPMIKTGEYCTSHLINAARLQQFKGSVIFNAARGGCVDNAALLQWLDSSPSHLAALDCWENEPSPMIDLVQHPQTVIATPHIAGHSLDGKAANTQYIYNALCQFLNIQQQWDMQQRLPSPPEVVRVENNPDPWQMLYKAASGLYPLLEDHDTMKSWVEVSANELPHAFSCFRRHYPIRRSWQCSISCFEEPTPVILKLADAFGMKIV